MAYRRKLLQIGREEALLQLLLSRPVACCGPFSCVLKDRRNPQYTCTTWLLFLVSWRLLLSADPAADTPSPLEERLSPRTAGMGTADDLRLDDDSSFFFLLDDRPSPVLLMSRRVLLLVVESPLIMLVAVPAVITF